MVAPLASAYVGVVVMLFVYSRSPKRQRQRDTRLPTWPALVRHLVTTSVAGYLIFLGIVVVFSFMFADQPRAIRQALAGGGFLAVVALVGLASLGWVEGRVRRRRASRGVERPPPPA